MIDPRERTLMVRPLRAFRKRLAPGPRGVGRPGIVGLLILVAIFAPFFDPS